MKKRRIFASIVIAVLAIGILMPAQAISRDKDSTGSDNSRLQMKPEKIQFQGEEFDGMRGTLYVPQNRKQPDSKVIELPVIVVKALGPNPDYPVFQFGGGPGLSNMSGQGVNELDLQKHDIVLVGYRGVDGTPTLSHPMFSEVLKIPDALSESGIRAIGAKAKHAVQQLREAGIDVSQYSIQNTIEDVEAARIALGYGKINVTGGSYGGSVVAAYCLMYPNSIHRAVMIEAPFPYDIAFGRPEQIDARFEHINELWKKDPNSAARSADIVRTIRNVLANLPAEYKGIRIDPSKVRFMTSFGITDRRVYANMVLDAYVSAEKGDFGSIAAMCLMYDQFMGFMQCPGDLLAKTYSSVTDPERDFVAELRDPASVVGSPMSMIAWGGFQYSDWPVEPFVKRCPQTEKSDVETLIFYGSKQTGEPLRDMNKERFTHAHWVILDDLGHTDVWTITASGTHHLIQRFLDEGVVDTSRIGPIPPWDFLPEATFSQLLQQMMPTDREAAEK